ncbi:MAG: hypothetical protein PHF67_00655 [Candidatus Nanoarchaeia archaeon]|nr:hypothetical protein [Candidatus Nanoarchaeia archaeon]
MANLNSLLQITTDPLARNLLNSTLRLQDVDLFQRRAEIDDNHSRLVQMSEGNLYYELAMSIIRDLEEKLVFVEEFPFPKYSPRRGTEHKDVVFVNGGPVTGLAFPDWDEAGKVRVEIGCGPYAECDEPDLSTRMHVQTRVIDSMESFRKFVHDGLHGGFRNANPFKKNSLLPENVGDLVYCVEYPNHPKTGEHSCVPNLGNILPPKSRLGVIERTDGNYEQRVFFIKGFDGKTRRYARKNQDRYFTKIRGFIDDLLLVRLNGCWDMEDVTSTPLMRDDEVEEVVVPTLVKYGEDPRTYTHHIKHQGLLRRQYRSLLETGASPREVVECMNEDYGVSLDDVLKIGGVRQKDLAPSVLPKLRELLKEIRYYRKFADVMIGESAKLLSMSPEELVLFGSQRADAELRMPELSDKYYFRRVRGRTYNGRGLEGYLTEIHDHGDVAEWGANLYTNMTNPEEQNSVAFSSLEVVGLDGYRQVCNSFELELVYYFLRHQTEVLESAGDRFKETALHAREFLEAKLDEYAQHEKQKAKERKRQQLINRPSEERGRYRETNWENELEQAPLIKPGEDYSSLMGRLDEFVMGPLLSFGYSHEDAGKFVLKHSHNNPLISRAIDDIIASRTRPKTNPFQTSLGQRMLIAARGGTGRLPNYLDVLGRLQGFKEGDGVDFAEAMEVSNLILAATLGLREGPQGALTQVAEMVEEAASGEKRKYFSEWEVGRMLEGCLETGGNVRLAINNAYAEDRERKRKQPEKAKTYGRTWIKDEPDGCKDVMKLCITPKDVDLEKCGLFLLEEIALMNKDDPRNRQFFYLRERLPEKDLLASLGRVPLYPLSQSNYYLNASVDKEHYRDNNDRRIVISLGEYLHLDFLGIHHDQHFIDSQVEALVKKGIPITILKEEPRHKKVSVCIANPQPVYLSYTQAIDVRSEIEMLRGLGVPVNIQGNHRLEQVENGFRLYPQYESGAYDGQLFLIGQVDKNTFGRLSKQERRLLKRMSGDEHIYDRVEFDHSCIYARTVDYYGPDRTRELLTRVGKRIEAEFNLDPGLLDRYLEKVESGRRIQLAPKQLLLGED